MLCQSPSFLFGFHVVREQFFVRRIRYAVQVNLDPLFAEFGTHVNNLNSSTALDCHSG